MSAASFKLTMSIVRARPFVGVPRGIAGRPVVVRPPSLASTSLSERRTVYVRAAAEEDANAEEPRQSRGGRRGGWNAEPDPEDKLYPPLPKPAHLVYVKPTVAVVADIASRASVGLRMTIGTKKLEAYVIEYYSRRL